MATDLGKLVYHTLEEHLQRQLGDEEFKKLPKRDKRAHLDDMMAHFARALVAIVVQVSNAHAEAQKAAAVEDDLAKANDKTMQATSDIIPPSAPTA